MSWYIHTYNGNYKDDGILWFNEIVNNDRYTWVVSNTLLWCVICFFCTELVSALLIAITPYPWISLNYSSQLSLNEDTLSFIHKNNRQLKLCIVIWFVIVNSPVFHIGMTWVTRWSVWFCCKQEIVVHLDGWLSYLAIT